MNKCFEMSVPCANAPQNFSYAATVPYHSSLNSHRPNQWPLSSAKLMSWRFYRLKSIKTVKSTCNKSLSRIRTCYSKQGRDLQVQFLKRVWVLVFNRRCLRQVRCLKVRCQITGVVWSGVKATRPFHRCAILNSTQFLRTTHNRISRLQWNSA